MDVQEILESMKYFVAHDGNDESIPAIMLEGEPGAGKTYAAKLFAKRNNYAFRMFQCTEGTGMDEMIYSINVPKLAEALSIRGAASGEDSLYWGVVIQAFLLSHDMPVVLLIDELDKSKPSLDAHFLAALNDGAIYHPMFAGGAIYANKKNIYVLFTSNALREFAEPLARRWVVIPMQFPDKKEMPFILLSMLGEERYFRIGDKVINLFIDFLYQWRSNKPKKTLVQNEICRVLTYLDNALQAKKNKEQMIGVLKYLISPHPEDHFRWERDKMSPLVNGLTPAYLVGKFIGDYGKDK